MSRRRRVHGMSQQDLYLNEVGPRCAWWLRSAWSGSRAKNVANLLQISEQQAKRLLGGARPTSEQLTRLARHFGWRFLTFVMEPAVGPPASQSDIINEMAQLRAEVASTREEIANVSARLAVLPMARLASQEVERAGGAGERSLAASRDAGAPARGVAPGIVSQGRR